jgi:hypothetical protein
MIRDCEVIDFPGVMLKEQEPFDDPLPPGCPVLVPVLAVRKIHRGYCLSYQRYEPANDFTRNLFHAFGRSWRYYDEVMELKNDCGFDVEFLQ